jgi:hypothetical protein
MRLTPMSLSEILAALLDATPLPQSTMDPEELLAVFNRMHERRAGILAHLDVTGALSAAETAMAAELEARDGAWMLCLQGAKQATADQRISAARMRAYTP